MPPSFNGPPPSQPPIKHKNPMRALWYRPKLDPKDPKDNLRRYLRDAALVPFWSPCPDRSSLAFRIEPDPRHKLRKITILQLIPMENKIKNFIDKQIPCSPARDERCVAVNIRLRAPSFNVPELKYPKVLRIDQVESHRTPAWLIGLVATRLTPVLSTAASIVALVWPHETRRLDVTWLPPRHSTLFDEPPESDFTLAKFYRWGEDPDPDAPFDNKPIKVVIMAISLATLDTAELEQFMKMDSFPAFQMPERNVVDPNNENPPPILPEQKYTRAQKVWAKLWEECARVNCPYFIITNYHDWVFGVFTNGWTRALCSPLIPQEADRITVLQWIVFWYATSIKLPGAWTLPSVLLDFDHPDYVHSSRIAKRILFEGKDDADGRRAADMKWLDNIRSLAGPGEGSTQQNPNLANVWFTTF